MIRKHFAGTVILAFFTCGIVSAPAWASVPGKRAKAVETNKPPATVDLRIRGFVFIAENDKAVRVHIVNSGGAVSSLCILRLTVRKINGIPVGRIKEVKLPPLGVGKNKWVVIDARSILPTNISLQSTTFKLNADATSTVTESDEANNEVWHNL